MRRLIAFYFQFLETDNDLYTIETDNDPSLRGQKMRANNMKTGVIPTPEVTDNFKSRIIVGMYWRRIIIRILGDG